MARNALFAAMLLAASGFAHASCVGTGSFRTCSDSSGNSYTVQQIGNTTYTNGYNSRTGNTWNQSSQHIGNTTFHNGTAANGNSWSGTTQRIGNLNIYNGTDSRGRSYSGSSFSNDD